MINWGQEFPLGTVLDLSHSRQQLDVIGIHASLFAVAAYEDGHDRNCRVIVAREVRDNAIVENGCILRFNTGSPFYLGAEVIGEVNIGPIILGTLVDNGRSNEEIVANIRKGGGHMFRNFEQAIAKMPVPSTSFEHSLVGIRREMILGEGTEVRQNVLIEARRLGYQEISPRLVLLLREKFPNESPFGFSRIAALYREHDVIPDIGFMSHEGIILRERKIAGVVKPWIGVARWDFGSFFFLFTLARKK